MTDDASRIDLTDRIRDAGSTNVHIRGYYGDDGENEGVLAISAVLDPGDLYPECARIIVGSPSRTPLLEGYIPALGGFSCDPDAADRLADELHRAAADARFAMAAGHSPGHTPPRPQAGEPATSESSSCAKGDSNPHGVTH